MRRIALVLVALLLVPVAAGAPSVQNKASGAFVFSEWDVMNFWVNATGWVNLSLTWALTSKAEDLSFTVYKPGVWDEQCPPEKDACTFFQHGSDIVAQSRGCPPFRTGEGVRIRDMPAGRYHVVVEGNLGWNVPYTLATDHGSLTYNQTTRIAGQVYVPPC